MRNLSRRVSAWAWWTLAPAALVTPAFAAAAAALGVLAYVNTLHNPFVFDDRTEILENSSIRAIENLPQILRHYATRPLTNLSYAVDYAFTGVDPFAYHVTNVLLHVVTIVLLFALVLRLTRDADRSDNAHVMLRARVGGFIAATLLAVHPLMTEAVGYISSRADLLCAVFFLASLLCFRYAFVGQRRGYTVAGTGLFLLALMSKETGVMLPFVLLSYDRLVLVDACEERRRRFVRIHLPLLATVLVVGLLRIWLYVSVEHPNGPTALWNNLLTQLYVTSRYLGMLVLPYDQTIAPAVPRIGSLFETRMLVVVGLLVLLIRGAYLVRRRLPIVAYGVVWFLLALIPSAALLLLADVRQPMAEHRVYLASCGIFLAVGGVVQRVLLLDRSDTRLRVVTLGASVALVLPLLLTLTVQRNRIWSNPVTLWEDAAERAPRSWLSHFGVAAAYRAKGDYAAAAASYERVIALRPDHPQASMDLANVLIALHRYGRAKEVLGRAMRYPPVSNDVRLTLASLEGDVFDNPQRALALCREAADAGYTADAEECIRRYERTPPVAGSPSR